ncbi:UNVERIFIED_CONTAM: hypothetical protein GTU68_027528 [Idotea baltica]|nr:hypothetical protein [Idotea baltica]
MRPCDSSKPSSLSTNTEKVRKTLLNIGVAHF